MAVSMASSPSVNILAAAARLLVIVIIGTLALLASPTRANQATTYFQRPDSNGRPQLMVAIYCGGARGAPVDALYHNQYLDAETRKWRSDRDASAICTQDKQEILNYCKRVYPNQDISNIVESSRLYKIDSWCRVGASSKRRCRTRLTVRPYRCLEGAFQSDALLVPERCLFDHVHNKTVCESSEAWSRTAGDNCHQKGMKLQSYSMLQPCALDRFSGVEFVCCPAANSQEQLSQLSDASSKRTSSPAAPAAAAAVAAAKGSSAQDGNSFAQAANGPSSWPKMPHYDLDESANKIKLDEGPSTSTSSSAKQHRDSDDSEEKEEPDNEDDDDDEDDEDEDEFDDDSSSVNGADKGGFSAASTTSTSTTTTTTTTTTTERPVDHYLSHFDLSHEHDEFRRAELAVEASYREKITHVMKEWGQLEGRYEEMKKKDLQAAEKFKQEMTQQFQKTIQALEEEGAAQRHQLASMHAERAMAIINRRKKIAMDCLTQALDRSPIKTRPVDRCITKLLKALEKDRAHTLRQYRNLLNINTREALREKKIILDHLVTLNRAANQSIAMLDRSPTLVEKLKNKTIALWHKLRNVPLSEPIVRESELKTMERFEEEVAQRKIEQERQRLIEQEAVQDTPQEATASNNKETAAALKQQNQQSAPDLEAPSSVKSPSPEAKQVAGLAEGKVAAAAAIESLGDQRADITSSTTSRPESAKLLGANDGHDDRENEIPLVHYQIDSARFSHLKADAGSHHELSSYTTKKEPLEFGRVAFGYSTFLVSACTIVIVIALIGFRYYSRHSARAYRRQGFAEVGRSCPEEKTVTNLQFNGYENPAYKFFEAEA